MTDDTAPAAETPPPAAPAPAAQSWQAPPPPSAPGIPGFVYADVPNRFIALIIDGIVIIVILAIIAAILSAVGLNVGVGKQNADLVGSLVYGVVSLVVGAGYLIYSWTSMRASVGMRVLGMQVGNAFDGKTLTMDQAMRRFGALWGPSIISSALQGVAVIGNLLSLLTFFYLIYLLWTTAKSPTKQGFHDTFANTVVVKAARGV
jgi:uncharacterized RDD family membrane protein YckC